MNQRQTNDPTQMDEAAKATKQDCFLGALIHTVSPLIDTFFEMWFLNNIIPPPKPLTMRKKKPDKFQWGVGKYYPLIYPLW